MSKWRRVSNAAPLLNSQGDSILNQALSEIGGKGLFTKELDVALLDHSVSAPYLWVSVVSLIVSFSHRSIYVSIL